MKSIKLFLLIIACSAFFSACETKKDVIPEMEVTASKYVELPNYQGYTIEKNSLILSEDELNNIILFNLSYNEIYKEVENRYLLSADDIAKIDFEMYIDEELYLFESDYYYFMGSNQLTQEFEKNILGQQVKTERRFTVSFPNDYQDSSLASQTANITVYLDSVYSLVDISDEEIIISYYNCNSMSEVYELMQQRATKKMIFDYVINKIFEEAYILSFPIQGTLYVNEMIENYKDEAARQGIAWDIYLESIEEMTEDALREELESFYCQFLIMKAITEKENLEYTIQDFDFQVDILSELDNVLREDILKYYDPLTICYEMMSADLEDIIPSKFINLQ